MWSAFPTGATVSVDDDAYTGYVYKIIGYLAVARGVGKRTAVLQYLSFSGPQASAWQALHPRLDLLPMTPNYFSIYLQVLPPYLGLSSSRYACLLLPANDF